MIDLNQVRAETRGCERHIHFNNAGAALMPVCVADALHQYLHDEELDGGYETALARDGELEHFYDACARLLNCHREEIAYVENATRAWDMAFYSIPMRAGQHILTTMSEYGSNVIAYQQRCQRDGVELVFVPDDAHGQIDVQALAQRVNPQTALISISHIPTGGGLVNPAAEVGAVARAAGVPYLLDACQAVGQIPLDVEAIGCDFLCGTGRKYLRGPRATGFLYVRREWITRLEPPFVDQHAADLISPEQYRLRDDARRFENWEQNFAGKVGLGIAIDYALALGLDNIRDRVYALAATLRQALGAVPGIAVTDQGAEQCGIVTFVSAGQPAGALKQALAAHGIATTVSDGSGPLVSFKARGLSAVLRASVHYYNTEQEVTRFVEAVRALNKIG